MDEDPPQSQVKRQKLDLKADTDVVYKRVDATQQACNQNVVGYKVKVHWPADNAWYEGVIASFDDETREHKVNYNDGESETFILATEAVQVQLPSSCELPLLTAEDKVVLAKALDSKVKRIEAIARERRNGKGRLTKDDREIIQKNLEKATFLKADVIKLQTVKEKPAQDVDACAEPDWPHTMARMDESWRGAVQQLRVARLAGQPVDATALEYLELYESFHCRPMELQYYKLMDVALSISPTALIGRKVKVWWENDQLWYSADVMSFNKATHQHKVIYDDDNTIAVMFLAVEDVMVQTRPGEVFPPPTSEDIIGMSDSMDKAAEEKLQEAEGKSEEDAEDLKDEALKLHKDAARIRAAVKHFLSDYPALPLPPCHPLSRAAPQRGKTKRRPAPLKCSPVELLTCENGVNSSTSTNTSTFPPMALQPASNVTLTLQRVTLNSHGATAVSTGNTLGKCEDNTTLPSLITFSDAAGRQPPAHLPPKGPSDNSRGTHSNCAIKSPAAPAPAATTARTAAIAPLATTATVTATTPARKATATTTSTATTRVATGATATARVAAGATATATATASTTPSIATAATADATATLHRHRRRLPSTLLNSQGAATTTTANNNAAGVPPPAACPQHAAPALPTNSNTVQAAGTSSGPVAAGVPRAIQQDGRPSTAPILSAVSADSLQELNPLLASHWQRWVTKVSCEEQTPSRGMKVEEKTSATGATQAGDGDDSSFHRASKRVCRDAAVAGVAAATAAVVGPRRRAKSPVVKGAAVRGLAGQSLEVKSPAGKGQGGKNPARKMTAQAKGRLQNLENALRSQIATAQPHMTKPTQVVSPCATTQNVNTIFPATNPAHPAVTSRTAAQNNNNTFQTAATNRGSTDSCHEDNDPIACIKRGKSTCCLMPALSIPAEWQRQYPHLPSIILLDQVPLPPKLSAALQEHILSAFPPRPNVMLAHSPPPPAAAPRPQKRRGVSPSAASTPAAAPLYSSTNGPPRVDAAAPQHNSGVSPSAGSTPGAVRTRVVNPRGVQCLKVQTLAGKSKAPVNSDIRTTTLNQSERPAATNHTTREQTQPDLQAGPDDHVASDVSMSWSEGQVGPAPHACGNHGHCGSVEVVPHSRSGVVQASERDSCTGKDGCEGDVTTPLKAAPRARGRKKGERVVKRRGNEAGTSPLRKPEGRDEGGMVLNDVLLEGQETSPLPRSFQHQLQQPQQQPHASTFTQHAFVPSIAQQLPRDGPMALAVLTLHKQGCTTSGARIIIESQEGEKRIAGNGERAGREHEQVLLFRDGQTAGHTGYEGVASGVGVGIGTGSCGIREREALDELLGSLSVEERETYDQLRAAMEEKQKGSTWISERGLGQIVWVAVKGFPFWPALVVSRSEARLEIPDAENPRPVLCVGCFGSYDYHALTYSQVPNVVMSFPEGIFQGKLKLKGGSTEVPFRKALKEVAVYLKTGRPPDELNRDVSTDREMSVQAAEDDDCFRDDGPGPAQKGPRNTGPGRMMQGGKGWLRGAGKSKMGGGEGVRAVYQLGNLKVLELGRVEYLNPAFHDEQAIFPVGFCAERSWATMGQTMRLEIGRNADGLLPSFRIFRNGQLASESTCPNDAWTQAVGQDSWQQKQSLIRVFGLNHVNVLKLVLEQPGAKKCDKFLGLEAHQREPLEEAELQQRLQLSVRTCKLGAGVWPVEVGERTIGICDICGQEDEYEDDLVIECDRCHVAVHMQCYGVSSPPNGSLWLCDVCSLGVKQDEWPACAICPVVGGAMKRSNDWKWCHMMCAQWIPETHFAQDTIRGLDKIKPARLKLQCSLCRQQHGACIQCTACQHCYTAFHPTCARKAKLPMVCREGAKSRLTPIKPGFRSPGPRVPSASLPSLEVPPSNVDAIVNLTTSPPSTPTRAPTTALALRQPALDVGPTHTLAAASAPAAGSTPMPAPVPVKSAKCVLGEPMLQCFCFKHRQHKPKGPFQYLHVHPTAMPSPQQTAAPTNRVVNTARPAPSPGWRPEAADGCARSRPYNEALRRGPREPEVQAAAMQKRFFVQSLPYLCTSAVHQQELPESFCHDLAPEEADDICPRWFTPAAHLSPATAHKPNNTSSLPSNPAQNPLHTSNQQAIVPVLANMALPPSDMPMVLSDRPLPLSDRRQFLSAWSLLGSHGSREEQETLSMTERYLVMKQTVGRRITAGKSAIHGWGAFTKVHHKAGDMVVEYVGELVRPSIADLRERQTYNTLVGAGTYIFRLNDQWNVDATKAGNLAHLLNHSCEPNCKSRTVPTVNPATRMPEEHVIIFAEKDIPPMTELTYDYRFAGEERLVCNCGAPKCRGFVNVRSESDPVLVNIRELKTLDGKNLV